MKKQRALAEQCCPGGVWHVIRQGASEILFEGRLTNGPQDPLPTSSAWTRKPERRHEASRRVTEQSVNHLEVPAVVGKKRESC
jgi:hypothetical protein